MFQELLNRQAGSAERPKPLPVGTYILQVVDVKFDQSRVKKTPQVDFVFAVLGPTQDVDQTQLVGVDYSKKRPNHTFYLTDDALYRLDDFLFKALKMSLQTGETYAQIIPRAKGNQVL